MWNCPACNNEVDDPFDNCPRCGTGRDGSEPPVDFVIQKDALQPALPASDSPDLHNRKRLISVIVVIAVILVLLFIAFGGRQ